jgi:hypothetical protein
MLAVIRLVGQAAGRRDGHGFPHRSPPRRQVRLILEGGHVHVRRQRGQQRGRRIIG